MLDLDFLAQGSGGKALEQALAALKQFLCHVTELTKLIFQAQV